MLNTHFDFDHARYRQLTIKINDEYIHNPIRWCESYLPPERWTWKHSGLVGPGKINYIHFYFTNMHDLAWFNLVWI